jgi:hypothetical protein
MSEIEASVRKQTKTERILNILLLLCAILYLGELIFSYIQPDPEYLEFARNEGWNITAFLGLVIGVLLVTIISGRKSLKKQRNRGLFFLLVFLPFVVLFIVVMALVFSFVRLRMSNPDPNDYLLPLLSILGVMFVYGLLLSFVGLYIDEIAEKLKKSKSDNEIEDNVQRLTKTEKTNYICWLFCAVVLCGMFLLCYPLPDSKYLEFARDMGWYFIALLGMFIGAVLISVISGKKRVGKAKNAGLLVLFGCVLCITILIFLFSFSNSFFIHRGFFDPTDPNDYLRILLSLSGLMFIVGIFISLIDLYIDDFVEKYFKGVKF